MFRLYPSSFDPLHWDSLRVTFLFLSVLVSVDDLGDVLFRQLVLPFPFFEMLGGVDEEDILRFFALLEHEDANGDTGRVEQVGGQTYHGVNVAARVDRHSCTASLLLRLFQHCPAPLGSPVLLFAAGGLVRDGHFDELFLQERLEELIPELGAVGAIGQLHQVSDCIG